jgi:hypothetical protein
MFVYKYGNRVIVTVKRQVVQFILFRLFLAISGDFHHKQSGKIGK